MNLAGLVLLDYPISPLEPYNKENKHPHEGLMKLIEKNRGNYQKILQNTIRYKHAYATITEDKLLKNDVDPGWNNGYLPGLDIVMLYSLLAQLNPSKFFEIGSGTSTKVAYKSRKENSLRYEIISVDPAPRRNISKVSDKIYAHNIQQIDPEIFQLLDKDDVLFFDGTHMLYPNSDVTWFFWKFYLG